MNTLCSIIITTFNTRELTLRSIESILRYPPTGDYQIIIVDNHSTDETIEAINKTYPQVITVRNESNLGYSKACNRGASRATGKYLLFLNSDIEAKVGTFDTLIQWLDRHPTTGIVGPELLGTGGGVLQISWVWNPLLLGEVIQQYFAPYAVRRSRIRQRMIGFLQRKSTSVPSICGACLLIRRDAFEQIHGFDEDFELYFEDSDLCLRCKQAGWRIDFVAESKITHHLGQSTRGSWNSTSLIYQQSHIAFYRKHAARWAVQLLKVYLFMKWTRLRYRVWREPQEHARALAYCHAYLHMIFERNKITLQTGIPA